MTNFDAQSDSDFGPFRGGGGGLGMGSTGVQGQLRGRGTGTPEDRHMPYARHMGVHILQATTKEGLITAFDEWKHLKDNERYRVMDLRLDVVATDYFILLIIYSQ